MEELAMNYLHMATQAGIAHQYTKALILISCTKLMLMFSKTEPPRKCFNIWLYNCAFEAHAGLGMVEEALNEVSESEQNQDLWLKKLGVKLDSSKSVLHSKLLLFLAKLGYYEEATEAYEKFIKMKHCSKEYFLGIHFQTVR